MANAGVVQVSCEEAGDCEGKHHGGMVASTGCGHPRALPPLLPTVVSPVEVEVHPACGFRC